jgi:hypothetical protein
VDRLEHHFRRFLAIDPGLPLVLALWSLATHLYDVFDAFAYLAVTSPIRQCGKTRAAEVLELFCARPLRTVGMTAAVLFRSIERDKPTLIVDEAEGLRGSDERASALREILNVGYRVGQKVRRCESNGSGYGLKEFETFCPKVLVLIGSLPDTLADRTIPIRMRRRYQGEPVDRFTTARAKQDTGPLRTECERWATASRSQVKAAYDGADLAFLRDREAELWLPLHVVCRIAAPTRLSDLEAVARRLASVKAGDEPQDNSTRLLSDVRDLFAEKSCDRFSTSGLLFLLNGIEGAPWEDYLYGKPLNAHALAKLLHPFGIRSQNIRIPAGVVKGYLLEVFKDAFDRYLPAPSATPLQNT